MRPAAQASALGALAWRDLLHNPLSTLCLALSAAIALAPVLLLFGLNYGFVHGLIAELREDPRTRELRPAGQYAFDADWFATLRADPRVGFVLPRTRYLASTTRLRSDAPGVHDAELIPTAPGDPLTPPGTVLAGPGDVALSASLAAAASLETGDPLTLIFSRRGAEGAERARLEARVIAVLERGAYQRDAVFADPALVDAAERWREGEAVPAFGAEWAQGSAPGPRASHASFRLFARDVRDVPPLRDAMIAMGVDVRTEEAAISRALAIEAGLGWVFAVILALSGIGVLLTLGFQLAAATAEKAAELSVLRLLGMTGAALAAIPMIQGALIGMAAAAIAAFAVLISQPIVNERLSGLAGFDGPLSRLSLAHAAAAVAAMGFAGAVSGAAAGRRAARLEPAEGLRHD
jgi:putative ABC transport system permease protein